MIVFSEMREERWLVTFVCVTVPPKTTARDQAPLIPPTAELGVLDDFSKPDEEIHKTKIRWIDLFGVFFAYV